MSWAFDHTVATGGRYRVIWMERVWRDRALEQEPCAQVFLELQPGGGVGCRWRRAGQGRSMGKRGKDLRSGSGRAGALCEGSRLLTSPTPV